MADVSKIKLPNGTTYDIKDNVSGYTTNTGTITKVQTTAGAHTTINVSSGAAAFNVPTKTSHLTNDSGFLTSVANDSHNHSPDTIYIPTNYARTGSLDLFSATKIGSYMSNKSFAIPPEAITIEYSTDGGSTWQDYGATDLHKRGLFAETRNNCNTFLGKATTKEANSLNNQLRITISRINLGRYTAINSFYTWMTTNGNTVYCKLERSLNSSPTAFETVFTDFKLAGWSGHNIRYFPTMAFGGGNDNQPYAIRLTVWQTAITTNYPSANLYDIRFYGPDTYSASAPYYKVQTNELYTWDNALNAIFPAGITATSFSGNLTGNVTGNVSGTAANVTGTVAIANGGTGQTTAANAINALLNGLPVWTADPTDTTYFVRQDTGGSATYGKVAFSTIWNYISGKLPAWSKASTKPSYNFSEIGSTPTTLSGYGITDAKIASGVITLGSNTITPLTSSSTLSAAKLSGAIPSAVTATTQASTDNSTKIATTAFVQAAMSSAGAGTVTSVGISNATNGGLSISGSPITSSGTITIGHSNVLSSAQTTQAVYPIKIDKNGHISAYGSAVTIPTIPSNNVTGSGSTNLLAIWSGTNTLSSNHLSISTSYNSSSDLYGKVKLYVGSTGQLDWQGQLVFYSGNLSKTITITPPSLATGSRTLTLPDASGTIALTSDIPTVSYPVTSVNNKTGAVSLTASDVGALASGTTYVSTITTTAGTHSAISSKSGAVSFNVPTKTSHLTNDSGYLTGITSSQVTTALGYTPYNSTNPNGYTSNTGTVTKVTAGTGLSIGTTAGGNFTTSGTINHTNSVTAQTTQAVYPIKIDAQGHISAYGSAVTIPTVPSNIVNTITTTAGAHTVISNATGAVSFNVPTTAAHVGAATSDHTHGNITNGGDITATAPTIASGDQIIINDNSASKITNGPTFDGSTTTTALTPKGTWETFLKSYTETDPTVPSWAKESTKPSYNFSEIGSTPTTIGDYGITDAKIASGTITLGNNTITPLTESSTLFYYDTFTASNYDFTASQYRSLTKSITAKTGYSRIIISVRCTSHSGLQVFNWSLSGNTITYEVINRTSSSISGANFAMNVLYIKSSLIGS